jgi:hypothetical protein
MTREDDPVLIEDDRNGEAELPYEPHRRLKRVVAPVG